MNQMTVSPFEFLHRMSEVPSPLKSPVRAITQLKGTTPNDDEDVIVAPFMSQILTSPLVLRHRMSAWPSPLKSPIP